MDIERSWQVIIEQRLALADLLETLDGEQWESASLCTGWRVGDVAAHVTMGCQAVRLRTALSAAIRSRGNFDRMNHDLAVAYAARAPAAIVRELREHAGSRTLPAVTNYRNMLFDVLIHVHDIALPLGLPIDIPDDAAEAAATNLWRLRWPWRTQSRFVGLRFAATDTSWSAGNGAEVRGPTTGLLLAISGRPVALPLLGGPGLPELTRRIAQPRAPDSTSTPLAEHSEKRKTT